MAKKSKKDIEKMKAAKKKDKKKSGKVNMTKLTRKVEKLQKALHMREDYISHLERLSDAYENLTQLSGKELKDADQVIQAQEIIQGLMTQERKHAEDIIRAHEIVEQLSAKEIDEARQIIAAQENVQGLMSKERKEAERIIQAHEIVETLSTREIEEAYQIIAAHERIHGLSSRERKSADSEIKAREQVSQLSAIELMSKDDELLRVLDINRGISAILEEKKLLKQILEAVAKSLRADRAVLFWEQDSRLIARARYKIREKDVNGPGFEEEMKVVQACKDTASSQMVLHQSIREEGQDEVLSMLAVPLIHLDKLQGVLYVDKGGKEKTFYSRDQFVAEIFAHQAVISLHNAELYKRVRKQNWDLLRLINLKNEFIGRLSQHITDPCKQLDHYLLKVEQCECQSCRKEIEGSRRITSKLSDTAERVMDLLEMEKEVESLTSHKVNFLAIIDQLKEKYAQELEHRNISIQCDLTKEFSKYPANETIIRAILDELIGNAIMYNKNEGSVSLKGMVQGEYLVLRIKDTGVGIAPEEQELIFDQFYRSLHSAELNESGAGLGLYMVKSFINYYHGKLELDSILGEGSTFTLSLLAM